MAHRESHPAAQRAREDSDSTSNVTPVSFDMREPVLPQRIGRYRVESLLGKGGFGCVYLAFDEQLNRSVAVKTPHTGLVTRPEDAETYLHEARAVAGLDHPHIVPVYDVGSTEAFPVFIVSKYIAGTTLLERVRNSRPTWREAAEWTAAVADALHYAHKRGLVHRDVKPSNILLDRTGQPHVVDFGLALRESELGKGSRWAGTPAYMSPEQASGEGHRVDGRSDIYSLGAVFYLLLAGRRTFSTPDKVELLSQIASQDVKPPRQIDDAVPRELERICLRALARRASDRYCTALDMAEDLRNYLADPGLFTTLRCDDVGPPPAERTIGRSLHGNVMSQGDSANQAINIVPKGLRSFDQNDADFYLELLPGPRDRRGLPESIRFWKSRIEEDDPDKTFRVGVIYGPSGCGKSSLVRAGLLPRLGHRVASVYLEATSNDTEFRLRKALRRSFPDLPEELNLKGMLAALRRGEVSVHGRKVLIVLDQFEQWLHAHRDKENTELAQALRQCDGASVQSVVLVRDDFWMAITWLMRELEIPLVEGQNSIAVDLFPLRHSRKVLAAYGKAFGALPDSAELEPEHRQFLTESVRLLAQDDKVICVRLALFAEMMKGRPWTPSSLRELGGFEGVGATFLEETFSASSAPPTHRFHQHAARAVLQALLPVAGTEIKGRMRSTEELRERSGYMERPREFAELIHILDSEVRLITPADPDDEETVRDEHRVKYYQLTHDYLVTPLREWLYRKQKETRRGRAELRLADQAALWNARPENRHLPSLGEVLGFLTLTDRKNWSDEQRRMMRTAGRFLATRGAFTAIAVFVLLAGGWDLWGRFQSQAKIKSLLHAPTAQVPMVVEELATYHRWAEKPLQQMLVIARERDDARQQLHASLALLPRDASQVDYLLTRLLSGNPSEVVAIREVMQPYVSAAAPPLWKILEDPQADLGQRLRAACFLAHYFPDDPRWDEMSISVANRLATENALLLREWAEALWPIRGRLLPALANLIADSGDAARRRRLIELYAEFAARETDGFSPLKSILAEQSSDDRVQRVALARRKAAAAAALASLQQWDDIWPLLKHEPDPTLRSYLIDRLAEIGPDVPTLLNHLDVATEPEGSVRRAILLVLGELTSDDAAAASREEIVRVLQSLRDDPDPAVRSTIDWVMARWERQANVSPRADEHQRPQMIVIRPGEIEADDRFGQRRTLRVNLTFSLATRETTVAEFLRHRPNHVWDERSAHSQDCPINEVSWYDAAAYCNWLSQQENLPEDQWCYEPNSSGEYAAGMKVKAHALELTGYRLPTVEEWEFACRSGSVTQWSFGDAPELLDRYGWSIANSGVRSRPVGLLRPNDLGLFDMYGNVWEWCHDEVDNQGRPVAHDQSTDEIVSDGFRPLRGGTYLNDPSSVDSNAAIWNPPWNHTGADGFRVARTVSRTIEGSQ